MIQKKRKILNKKIVKILKQEHAFKYFASTYNVEFLNSFNTELQLKDTEYAIKSKLIEFLTQLEGFRFVITLVLVFTKIESEDRTKYDNFYLSSKAEIIINESDTDDVFKSFYSTIISNIQKSFGKGSGWIIDSVIEHTISISKYNPLARSSYIIAKKINHPRKRLINIQNNDDNECFKWSIVRYLNLPKSDEEFAKNLDFKDKKFPLKIREIHKIEKKNSIDITVFRYKNKEKHPIYVSKKCCEENYVDLLVIGEEGKKYYVLIKGFNTFPLSMRRCSSVSFRSHIGRDIADRVETSSRRRNWYVNKTDLFEMSLRRLIGT